MQHELIAHHGYIPETHNIWTEDDYCLTVHRITAPDKSNVYSTKTYATSNAEQAVIDTLEKSTESNLKSVCKEYSPLSKPPVIINHGALSSSADWVLLGPQKALGMKS